MESPTTTPFVTLSTDYPGRVTFRMTPSRVYPKGKKVTRRSYTENFYYPNLPLTS